MILDAPECQGPTLMSAISIPQCGRVPSATRAQRHYPEEGTMTVTLEDRVEVLEGKVENLETWAGPGQNEALSRNLTEFREMVSGKFAKFDKAQEKQSQTLDIHTGKLNGLEESVRSLAFDMLAAKHAMKQFKEEVSGKLERLDDDVTGLKANVTGLKANVTGLKANVTGLKSDMAAFKVEVTGTLAEILDRLPPKAA